MLDLRATFPTQVPRCPEDPVLFKSRRLSSEEIAGLRAGATSISIMAPSIFSTGGRPQAGDAYARDDSVWSSHRRGIPSCLCSAW